MIDIYGNKIDEFIIVGIVKISSRESVSHRKGSCGYAIQVNAPLYQLN